MSQKIRRGCVIRVEAARIGVFGFDHYGIYAGNKRVIHFADGIVKRESLEKFIEGESFFNGRKIDVMGFPSHHIEDITLEESYQRAKSHLGMTGYDLFSANCEHFAVWCRTGQAISSQAFGGKTDKFDAASAAYLAAAAINLPRLIGKQFNKVGMERNRTICIDHI